MTSKPSRQQDATSKESADGKLASFFDDNIPAQACDWRQCPLELACAEEKLDLISKLLQALRRRNPTIFRQRKGRYLWKAAVESGNDKVVSMLLRAGAAKLVNDKLDHEGRTALHRAALLGHGMLARLLLQAGATVNALDDNRCTPLHLAASLGHGEIISILLRRKASPHVKDMFERTPLHFAACGGHAGIVRAILRKGTNAHELDFPGPFPLDQAVGARSHPSAPIHITKYTALEMAACCGKADVVDTLMDYGAETCRSENNTTGHSAMHLAATYDQANVIDVLTKSHEELEAQDSAGWTPLHSACRAGACEATLALLKNGANADAKDNEGNTSMHLASQELPEGAGKVVDLLLRWGADETVINESGATALQVLTSPVMDPDMDMSDEDTDADDDADADEAGDADDLEEADEGTDETDVVWALARFVDFSHVYFLLDRAPADKAWRRRGLFILCREKPQSIHVVVAGSRDVGDKVETSSLAKSSRKRIKKKAVKPETGRVMSCYGRSNGSQNVLRVEGRAEVSREAALEWSGLVTKVINLDMEEIFRMIILFL